MASIIVVIVVGVLQSRACLEDKLNTKDLRPYIIGHCGAKPLYNGDIKIV